MTEDIELGWRARVADWWAEHFLVDDKRSEFRAALRARLDLIEFDELKMGNDYDPSGAILDAVRDIGIECRGCMFSGDGLFPRKTRMETVSGRFVIVKEGYGKRYQILCGDWKPEGE